MPKIPDYPALTTPNNNDQLVIEDSVAGSTKSITREDFLAGSPLPADTVDTQAIENDAVTASKVDWAATGANGGIWWEEVGRTTLTVAADNVTVSSLPARRYYKVVANCTPVGGTTNHLLRFNGDSGTNYSERSIEDGASLSNVSVSSITLAGNTNATPAFLEVEVFNVSNQEKRILFQGSRYTTGAATAPSGSRIGWGKWANTAASINSISINNTGTGDYDVGSEMVVLGHN